MKLARFGSQCHIKLCTWIFVSNDLISMSIKILANSQKKYYRLHFFKVIISKIVSEEYRYELHIIKIITRIDLIKLIFFVKLMNHFVVYYIFGSIRGYIDCFYYIYLILGKSRRLSYWLAKIFDVEIKAHGNTMCSKVWNFRFVRTVHTIDIVYTLWKLNSYLSYEMRFVLFDSVKKLTTSIAYLVEVINTGNKITSAWVEANLVYIRRYTGTIN